MDESAHAHDTGLYGNIEFSINQPVIVQPLPCVTQSKNFCVCRGILKRDGTIEGLRNNLSVLNYYRPDRNFILPESCAGLFNSSAHKNFVVLIYQNMKMSGFSKYIFNNNVSHILF
jgi:hypothetical protein